MGTRPILVENVTNLNNLILQTFQRTQRLKLISFDVSQNYLVFGASSGGIYIFERKPYQFKKLIPGRGGVVELISVSPNEKNVALANSKGLIMILENCFAQDICRYQIYTEHEGQRVTSMKWNNTDLFCGDSSGKVSVILSQNLLTKAIFHTPVATILHLGLPIIQIDCFSKYLLVSTKARTYICDTEKEYFKPIGKKLRDGPFGACFLPKPDKTKYDSKPDTRTSYKEIRNSSEDITACKIYCSRPGGRLWEANFEASVICTQQFRNIHIDKRHTEILVLTEDPEMELSIISNTEIDVVPETFNLEKLFVVGEMFLLTFNESGFYVFDPATGSLLFWNTSYNDITDLKVIGSSIFIWQNKQVTELSLSSIEDIILRTLFCKQYHACAQLCIKFSEEILEIVENSSKMHLISVLKTKLDNPSDEDLLEKLTPLLEKVQHLSNQNLMSGKYDNAIKVVENAHYIEEGYSINDVQISEGLLNFKSITAVGEKINEGRKNIKDKFMELETRVKKLTTDSIIKHVNFGNKHENLPGKINRDRNNIVASASDKEIKEEEDPDDLEYRLRILLEQFRLNKIHKNVETSRVTRLYAKVTLDSLKELFDSFIVHAEEMFSEDASLWCKDQFLKYVHKRKLYKELSKFEKEVVDYLYEGFCAVNSKYSPCSCGYPCPSVNKDKPLYHEIGLALMNGPIGISNMRSRVSYMWRHYLLSLTEDDIPLNIALIFQYGDKSLVRKFLKYFFYDTWDDAIKYYIRLRSGYCLNCDNKIKSDYLISWTDFGLLMLESIGGVNTLKLMQSNGKYIPERQLDPSFYQACIFLTSVGELESNFGKNLLDLFFKLYSRTETRMQLEKSLAKFLRKKYLVNSVENNFSITAMNCTFCDIPVNIQVLEYKVLKCSHFYHDLCLMYNENICILCNKDS